MRLASLLALTFLLCTSCVTASVWGGGVAEDENGESTIVWSGNTPLSPSPWINALATPFALAFDICLSPVQAWMFGWRDDDDDESW
ncbi:MAG: hypothetical protein AAGG01_08025 [Planctomycetota bacterium]